MKLSVIVPVYNVEDYVQQCISSIANQSFQNLEIFLVDDGSTDGSLLICNEAAKNDPRIQVLSQKNGGVSAARNTGIKKATGDYITFVDSDDWLELKMYTKMLETANSNFLPDVLMCDFKNVFPESVQNISSDLRPGFYKKKEIIDEIFPTLTVTENFGRVPIVSACTCLFKKDFIFNNEINFDTDLKFSEDYLFTAACMLNAQSFYYLKGNFFYNYRQYGFSRSKKYDPHWWSNLTALSKKLQKLLINCPDFNFQRQLKLQFIHSVLFLSSSILKNKRFSFAAKIAYHRNLFNELPVIDAFYKLSFNRQSLSLKVMLFFIKHRWPVLFTTYRLLLANLKRKH